MACHTLAVEGPRDLNKAKRRDAILDAAVTLLGTRDSADITTEEIAALAGVSAATVYNLVGTRNELMYQLVSRILTGMVRNVERNSPTHLTSSMSRVQEPARRGKKQGNISKNIFLVFLPPMATRSQIDE